MVNATKGTFLVGKRYFLGRGKICRTRAVLGFCVYHHAAHGGALIFISK